MNPAGEGHVLRGRRRLLQSFYRMYTSVFNRKLEKYVIGDNYNSTLYDTPHSRPNCSPIPVNLHHVCSIRSNTASEKGIVCRGT
jgi:hypothetical protein